jgi:hypothetical protein
MRTNCCWLPGLLAAAFLLSGCCTSDECLDSRSTADRDRVTAPRIKLDLVYNDSVSSEKRDRTDWKYVMLTKPGKLTVQLHWDNGKALLELEIFDVMGVKVQEGRVWGTGGLRAVVAVEEPGPYYIRVRAAGKSDESQYAVRVSFQPQGGPQVCHPCKPLDRKCLDTGAVIVCEKMGPGCNAWNRVLPCPKGVTCRNGICDPCSAPCPERATRCVSATEFQVCSTQPGGACPTWGPSQSCPPRQQCREDRCVKPTKGPLCPAKGCPEGTVCNRATGQCVKAAAPPPPPPSTATRCRIISIYKYRGVWTLHLECGEGSPVKAGHVGTVLEGQTNKPLPGGEIKVIRVSGRFAIANTSLQQLGLNRWVRIDTR